MEKCRDNEWQLIFHLVLVIKLTVARALIWLELGNSGCRDELHTFPWVLISDDCADTSEHLTWEMKCNTLFPFLAKYPLRLRLCRSQVEFCKFNFPLCFNAWKVGPSIREEAGWWSGEHLQYLILIAHLPWFSRGTLCLHASSPLSPSYPSLILSITKIKSKGQTLYLSSLSVKQSRDSNLDLADSKTRTFEHETVFFHEMYPSLTSSHLSRCFFPPLGPDPAPTPKMLLGTPRHQLRC